MTPELLEKLKDSLPPKGIKTLADKFGFSEGYIYKIFKDDRGNEEVIDAAIQLAQEYKERLEQRIENIKSL